jgi:hypothetical protein
MQNKKLKDEKLVFQLFGQLGSSKLSVKCPSDQRGAIRTPDQAQGSQLCQQ